MIEHKQDRQGAPFSESVFDMQSVRNLTDGLRQTLEGLGSRAFFIVPGWKEYDLINIQTVGNNTVKYVGGFTFRVNDPLRVSVHLRRMSPEYIDTLKIKLRANSADSKISHRRTKKNGVKQFENNINNQNALLRATELIGSLIKGLQK